MSDEERPTSLDDARMAKALGVPIGLLMVSVADGTDDSWTRFPGALEAGLTRAMSGLGLNKPTDWPYSLREGQPCFALGEGCRSLAAALSALKLTAMGNDAAAPLAKLWAQQLEALMESMRAAGMQAYKLAKAQREIQAARQLQMERP